MHHDDNDDLQADGRPSKTKKKEAMQDLQDLGAALVGLSLGHLKRIDLPEDLLAAVLDWQRFTKHEARRRQLQYIGKLMRNLDPEPIRIGLAKIAGDDAEANARFHRLERLRTRFLEDEKVLQEIIATWPEADPAQLRQLRRNALKEKEAGKPPKNFRALFQTLKELDGQPEDAAPDSEGEGDDE